MNQAQSQVSTLIDLSTPGVDCAHESVKVCAQTGQETSNVRTLVRTNSHEKSDLCAQSFDTCAHKNLETRSERFAFRVTPKFKRDIELYCKARDYTITEFFELCAQDFIERRPLCAQGLLECAPYDDLMIDMRGYQTASSIIKRYVAYNFFFNKRTKWKLADDRVARRYNETDIRLIEIGIIHTQINKSQSSEPTTPINSFRYYTEEIDRLLTLEYDPRTIDRMLDSVRRAWSKTFGQAVPIEGEN